MWPVFCLWVVNVGYLWHNKFYLLKYALFFWFEKISPFFSITLVKFLKASNPTGIKVEGILRQSADVEEVERRVQEYEQG